MKRRSLAHFDSVSGCLSAALGIFNSGVMPIAMTAFNGNVGQQNRTGRTAVGAAIMGLQCGLEAGRAH